MNLVFDIGNTNVKAGVFQKDELMESRIFNQDIPSLELWIKSLSPDYVLISSVKQENDAILQLVNSFSPIVFTHQTKIPIINQYQTPHTLGLDRIAGAIGAKKLTASKNILTIDTGTAITFDLVLQNNYIGGMISPGIEIRLKSLHTFTGKLPLVDIIELEKVFFTIGKTTNECIALGILNGIIYEIDGTIAQFLTQYPDLVVYGTGGNFNFFANRLKNTIFAEPNLVLIGLNEILNYNVFKN